MGNEAMKECKQPNDERASKRMFGISTHLVNLLETLVCVVHSSGRFPTAAPTYDAFLGRFLDLCRSKCAFDELVQVFLFKTR